MKPNDQFSNDEYAVKDLTKQVQDERDNQKSLSKIMNAGNYFRKKAVLPRRDETR